MPIPFQPGRDHRFFEPQIKYKTADESVVSSATLQADNHLTGFYLEQQVPYLLEASLAFNAGGGDGPGQKIALVFTVAPWDYCGIQIHGADSVGQVVSASSLQNLTSQTLIDTLALGDNNGPHYTLKGFVFGPSSGNGLLELQWAQSASSATSVILNVGSWMKIQRMG